MFINDCCYAGSTFSYLKEAGISQEQVSVIAAVEEDDKTNPGVARRVLASWRQKKAHEAPVQRFIKIGPYEIPSSFKAKLGDSIVGWKYKVVNWLTVLFPNVPAFVYLGEVGFGNIEEYEEAMPEVRWGAEFDHFFYPRGEITVPKLGGEIPTIVIEPSEMFKEA